MEEKKTSKGCLIASIVSLVITGLEILSGIMVFFSLVFAGTGSSHTAVTNEAVIGLTGMVLFIAGFLIIGAIGGLTGLVVAIIDLAKKQFKLVWMPVISVVLGIGPWIFIPMFMAVMDSLYG